MHNHESIGRYISCIHRHGHIYIDKEMSRFGLGSGTFLFLLPLFRKDGINQNMLTQKLHFDKAYTTRALQKLIDAGFIKRVKDEEDSRAYKIYITMKAKDLKPEIMEVLRSWSKILTKGLSKEEERMALNILQKMAENAIESFYNLIKIAQFYNPSLVLMNVILKIKKA